MVASDAAVLTSTAVRAARPWAEFVACLTAFGITSVLLVVMLAARPAIMTSSPRWCAPGANGGTSARG